MLSLRHCTAVACALAVLASSAVARAQPPATTPATGAASFVILNRGAEVGRFESNLARSGSTWILTSTARIGDLVVNRFELKYSADWQPVDLKIEATQAQGPFSIATSFGVTTAINEITLNGITRAKTDQISARAVVLPNNFFGAYEALAARLASSSLGQEIPIYVAPQAEVKLTVKAVEKEDIGTPYGVVATRKYLVSVQNPAGAVDSYVTIDAKDRLARLDVPTAGLTVVRTDLSGVSTRLQTARNPTDVDVTVPIVGFNIAGTLTMPAGEGRMRHPTVVLVAGAGIADREERIAGIPIFTEIAAGLAARGLMVLRYDKRGIGQSGGRSETSTLQDYADDLAGIVKWLAKRKDVDPRRLTIIGHGEGGAIAMLAAAREKKITSLVLVSTMGTTGAETVLEQQRHQLDLMKASPEERQQKIDLQQKIHAAVVTDKGWDALSPDVRRQADSAWFRSLLQFDPAKLMPKIKQPILILQGDLDTQVPPHHAERLAEMARGRKKAGGVESVHVPGVNHLLAKAETGEAAEYPSLPDKHVSPEVVRIIGEWLAK
jgi:alpha-beta hydrolase superfamily lysophospholipase